MQNKGAVKLFAVLLGLACIFYLSFTWITNGVEGDAKAYAENVVTSAKTKMAAKEYSKGDASRELSYIDSVKSYIADRYLDSMKKQTVYNYGDVFQPASQGLIGSLKQGDIVMFDMIQISMFDGTTRTANPMTFKIVE